MSKAAARQNLHEDLELLMNEVHQTLRHYGLVGYQPYLIARIPGKPQSYIVEGQASDKGRFDLELIKFHQELANAGK